jgi:3-hydroxyacyl-CoA dehydrogenase
MSRCRAASSSTLAAVDLVVEAVFRTWRSSVGCSPISIGSRRRRSGTNTSALNIDELAAATGAPRRRRHPLQPCARDATRRDRSRPGDERRGDYDGDRSRKLRQDRVVAGNCDGFIGNRMLNGYRRERSSCCWRASPLRSIARWSISALMGPQTMADMAGLDIHSVAAAGPRHAATIRAFAVIADRLFEMGRFGQKSGRAYA